MFYEIFNENGCLPSLSSIFYLWWDVWTSFSYIITYFTLKYIIHYYWLYLLHCAIDLKTFSSYLSETLYSLINSSWCSSSPLCPASQSHCSTVYFPSFCVCESVCVSACVTQRDVCVLGVLTNASTLCRGAYGGQEHLMHRFSPSTLLLLFSSAYTMLHGLRASDLSHFCFPS